MSDFDEPAIRRAAAQIWRDMEIELWSNSRRAQHFLVADKRGNVVQTLPLAEFQGLDVMIQAENAATPADDLGK